jgi:hypothetical protein
MATKQAQSPVELSKLAVRAAAAGLGMNVWISDGDVTLLGSVPVDAIKRVAASGTAEAFTMACVPPSRPDHTASFTISAEPPAEVKAGPKRGQAGRVGLYARFNPPFKTVLAAPVVEMAGSVANETPQGNEILRLAGQATYILSDAIRQRPLRSPVRRILPEVTAHFRQCAVPMSDAVTRGFAQMYRLVAACGLPLDMFSECHARVLLRASYLYQASIERSLHPSALSSSTGRRSAVDAFVTQAPPIVHGRPEIASRVADAERSSLLDLRVPRFYAAVRGRDLRYGGACLGHAFTQSAIERAHMLMRRMSPGALNAHCQDIRRAIAAAAQTSWRPTLPFEIVPDGVAQAIQ